MKHQSTVGKNGVAENVGVVGTKTRGEPSPRLRRVKAAGVDEFRRAGEGRDVRALLLLGVDEVGVPVVGDVEVDGTHPSIGTCSDGVRTQVHDGGDCTGA